MSEKYNHNVECIYLTIVNDRDMYGAAEGMITNSISSIDKLEKLAYQVWSDRSRGDRSMCRGIVWRAARDNDITISTLSHSEIRDIWVKLIETFDTSRNEHVFIEKFNKLACLTLSDDVYIDSGRISNAMINTLQENETMNELNNTPFKSIDYVYGQDISNLDAPQLLSSIKRAKKEIDDLKSTGVESTYIDGQVKGLESAVVKMVKALDSIEGK